MVYYNIKNGKKKFEKKMFEVKKNWKISNTKLLEEGMGPQQKVNLSFEKTREKPIGPNKGAVIGTKLHWFIIADQIETKLDDNSYKSSIIGIRFRIGRKRPHWELFNYDPYISKKERIIKILEDYIKKLREED